VPAQENPARRALEADRLGHDEAGAGSLRQANEVDMDLVAIVEAGDVARQHAGIGRAEVARDHGQPHAGLGAVGEGPKHDHMGMAAADEDDLRHGSPRKLPVPSAGRSVA
jgi:hypothetical protein